jgi:hypothetical protein
MRFCKRFDWLLGLFLCLGLCLSGNALAAGIEIKSAELTASGEAYLLNADFDVDFSTEVEEALSKGVPLNFLIEFQLVSPRRYWFDDEIVSASQRVRLSYHALSRQYLINLPNHQKSFATLQEALDELSKVHDWIVLEKPQIAKGETYQAMLRMRLDHTRLPKALQVEALGSEKWNLVSERYRWTPAL